jgi:hypothetical protein
MDLKDHYKVLKVPGCFSNIFLPADTGTGT